MIQNSGNGVEVNFEPKIVYSNTMELSFLPDSMTRYAFNMWHAFPNWEETNYKNSNIKNKNSDFSENKIDEKNCRICRHKRKRLLLDYIKNKQKDRQISITIQEDEKEEEEEEQSIKEEKNKT